MQSIWMHTFVAFLLFFAVVTPCMAGATHECKAEQILNSLNSSDCKDICFGVDDDGDTYVICNTSDMPEPFAKEGECPKIGRISVQRMVLFNATGEVYFKGASELFSEVIGNKTASSEYEGWRIFQHIKNLKNKGKPVDLGSGKL